jgi:hypothetical protein
MSKKISPEIIALRSIIERNGLSLGDLKQEIGSKGFVSMVLSGRRHLSKTHIENLSSRFRVNPKAFFEVSDAIVLAGKRKPVPPRNLFDPTMEPDESLEDRLLANVAIKANRKSETANKNLLSNLHSKIQEAIAGEC